jgi:hypothetical protein
LLGAGLGGLDAFKLWVRRIATSIVKAAPGSSSRSRRRVCNVLASVTAAAA